MFLVILGIFYFLLIRPQQRKFDAHNTMLKALKAGDRVVTAGGIIGTVAKLNDPDRATVTIAENVQIEVVRSTIAELAKPETKN